MPTTELLLGGVIMGALSLYAVFGGADFGGGVWDLFAAGPRKAEQRALIEKAIGPIWEANHVWLILAVVMLFAAFPTAFAVISIALHVPLTLFLIGQWNFDGHNVRTLDQTIIDFGEPIREIMA